MKIAEIFFSSKYWSTNQASFTKYLLVFDRCDTHILLHKNDSCGSGHIYWRNFNGKLQFLYSVYDQSTKHLWWNFQQKYLTTLSRLKTAVPIKHCKVEMSLALRQTSAIKLFMKNSERLLAILRKKNSFIDFCLSPKYTSPML